MIKFLRAVATVCLVMGLIMFLGFPQVEAQRQPSFGDPLPGLSATEFEEFLLPTMKNISHFEAIFFTAACRLVVA